MGESELAEQLRRAIEKIAAERGTKACAVAVHDCESDFRFSLNGDRFFHAASTIKVAILLALFKGVDDARFCLTSPLHVRNRFLSAIDRKPFRLDAESDGYPQLYKCIWRTAKISELADSRII